MCQPQFNDLHAEFVAFANRLGKSSRVDDRLGCLRHRGRRITRAQRRPAASVTTSLPLGDFRLIGRQRRGLGPQRILGGGKFMDRPLQLLFAGFYLSQPLLQGGFMHRPVGRGHR